jgi:hypothetical protein
MRIDVRRASDIFDKVFDMRQGRPYLFLLRSPSYSKLWLYVPSLL